MAIIRGKQAVIAIFTAVGLIAIVFGPQLIFQYSESGVNYNVYLERFTLNGDKVSGSVLVKVDNTNDFEIEVRDLRLLLYDPSEETPFFTIRHAGADIPAGQKIDISKSFTVKYDDIPDYEVRVVFSAYLKWNGVSRWITQEILFPIEW